MNIIKRQLFFSKEYILQHISFEITEQCINLKKYLIDDVYEYKNFHILRINNIRSTII